MKLVLDGHATERRVLDGVTGRCPFHDVGLSSFDSRQIAAEVQRQCAGGVAGRFEGLDGGSPQRRAIDVGDIERQTKRVPCAIPVERASIQGDMDLPTISQKALLTFR